VSVFFGYLLFWNGTLADSLSICEWAPVQFAPGPEQALTFSTAFES